MRRTFLRHSILSEHRLHRPDVLTVSRIFLVRVEFLLCLKPNEFLWAGARLFGLLEVLILFFNHSRKLRRGRMGRQTGERVFVARNARNNYSMTMKSASQKLRKTGFAKCRKEATNFHEFVWAGPSEEYYKPAEQGDHFAVPPPSLVGLRTGEFLQVVRDIH